jgi:NDP-sugar pyrophosphorylase family protein
MTVAMVLAAGLGTRLRPLTQERPKPLVEVLGAPLLHWSLRALRRAGVTRAAVNTHHLHPAIEDALGDSFEGLSLVYSHEPELLGTGGGVWQMSERLGDLDETVLLLNADALIDVDLVGLLAQHADRGPLATLALKDAPDKDKFALLGTDKDDRVIDFAGRNEVPKGAAEIVHRRMFCGVHAFEARLIDRLPPGVFSGINEVGYPPSLDDGEQVHAFEVPGYFCDVGTPERLLEANLRLLAGLELVAGPPLDGVPHEGRSFVIDGARVDSGAVLEGPVMVCAGAVVEAGARVGPHAVIGPDARVGRDARVERAVVQSGALAPAGEVVRSTVLGTGCRADADPAGVSLS